MQKQSEVPSVYFVPQTLEVNQLGGKPRYEQADRGFRRVNTLSIGPANTLVQRGEETTDLYGFPLNTYLLGGPVLDIARFQELSRQHIRNERQRMKDSYHHSDSHDDFARREAYLKELEEQEKQLGSFVASLVHGALVLTLEESEEVRVQLTDEQSRSLVKIQSTPHVARLNLSTR